jgi:hypothetical protein
VLVARRALHQPPPRILDVPRHLHCRVRTADRFEAATGHPLSWNLAAADKAAEVRRTAEDDAPGMRLPELMEVSKSTGLIHRQETLGATVAGLQVGFWLSIGRSYNGMSCGKARQLPCTQQPRTLYLIVQVNDLLSFRLSNGRNECRAILTLPVCFAQELIMYGLKGTCAYMAHAEALGARDADILAGVHQSLAFLASPAAADVNNCLGEVCAVVRSTFPLW